MDWNGFLLPLLVKWFPWLSEPVALALIGLIVSILTSVWKPKAPLETMAEQRIGEPPARPLIVAIPAVAGGVLAGVPGLFAGAIGDGIRRAGWTLIRWLMALVKKG